MFYFSVCVLFKRKNFFFLVNVCICLCVCVQSELTHVGLKKIEFVHKMIYIIENCVCSVVPENFDTCSKLF